MTKVVVVTPDVLAPQMAGPAIRAVAIAAQLADENHEVALVSTSRCDFTDRRFHSQKASGKALKNLIRGADVAITQGDFVGSNRWIMRSDDVVVFDLYDPIHLEALEQAKGDETLRQMAVLTSVAELNDQCVRGDFFVCASDRQRAFWLGQLAAAGRINPLTYDDDDSLFSLIDIAPFGVSSEPPRHNKNVLRGKVDGISDSDKIVLWAGGIYDWFDPITLIRAVDKLRHRVDSIRLVFMGTKHPNPGVTNQSVLGEATQLAESLGLMDKHVFFASEWIAYADRENYLLEADIAVSTHREHLETAFSFRTRILDHFWAGLPTVCTQGDSLADLIDRRGAGMTVPAGDAVAIEEALLLLLSDDGLRDKQSGAARQLAKEFEWCNTLRPLLEFCNSPRTAADRSDPKMRKKLFVPLSRMREPKASMRRDARMISEHLREGNVRQLFSKAGGRIKRRMRNLKDRW